jgi:hypothetical protein
MEEEQSNNRQNEYKNEQIKNEGTKKNEQIKRRTNTTIKTARPKDQNNPK